MNREDIIRFVELLVQDHQDQEGFESSWNLLNSLQEIINNKREFIRVQLEERKRWCELRDKRAKEQKERESKNEQKRIDVKAISTLVL